MRKSIGSRKCFLPKRANELDKRRLYRYAEQLRAAGLSLTNNIAEGSGSTHAQEFKQFLNIARRSLFEDASMLMVFESLGLFNSPDIDALFTNCDMLSRKITNFSRTARVGGIRIQDRKGQEQT